jgi:DNA-binding transcriptional ArsR family regulator
MSDEKIEEETYSLIFKTLRHPIRRKILRIMVDKQLAFSEILDILSIDSGHLSYHMENLGELVRHSPNGKYELSNIGRAAVNLMSGVEERPQLLTLTKKLGGRKVRKALLGAVLVILAVSTTVNIYFYNSSQDLTKRIQGSTSETAIEFDFSLVYATNVLESEANSQNIHALIRYFNFYMQSAWDNVRTLRTYLLPSYENSLLPIEDLLRNVTTAGLGGVGDTLDMLASRTNFTIAVEAFKELNRLASGKFSAMGHEIANAFEYTGTFSIVSSRLDNAIQIANDLKSILEEWVIKYSQM